MDWLKHYHPARHAWYLSRDGQQFNPMSEWKYDQTVARDAVRNHMRGTGEMSTYMMRVMCGMLETGEIKLSDLQHVGGENLVQQCRDFAKSIGVEL